LDEEGGFERRKSTCGEVDHDVEVIRSLTSTQSLALKFKLSFSLRCRIIYPHFVLICGHMFVSIHYLQSECVTLRNEGKKIKIICKKFTFLTLISNSLSMTK
jgi:hypothetical protein